MTDSMKFGPEWLRNMNNSDTSVVGGGGTPVPTVTIKMAEFRYGREEMLALFDRSILPPDPLKQMQGLYVDKSQLPLALIQMTDEETRMWNRGINSDAALRLSKPGQGVGVPGVRGALGGRGGSVDRGRGRARGSYHYSRGLSYEESDTTNGYNNRGMRSYERTQSQGNWVERNGGDPGDYTATSPRKEFGARGLSDTNWRRHRGGGEEEDGWRATRSEKWGRGSSNSWREGDGSWDRTRQWDEGTNSHPPPRKPWESEENNLPEWATENPSESGGSFDATGAFHGGSVYSDEEDNVASSSNQTRTEQSKSNSSQPRPAPHSKKEPPNITNGTPNSHPETGGGETHKSTGQIRQSQSATSLSSERKPINHPITSSASFSSVNNHTSQTNSESKPRRAEPPSKPDQLSNLRLKKPDEGKAVVENLQLKNHSKSVAEPIQVEKTNHEDEIEQRILDAADVFVSRLMDEEEREPSAVPPTTTSPPSSTPAHPHPLTDTLWYYQDPQGNVQGPFQSSEMAEWFGSGYFKGNLLVRRACDERYSPLSDLMKLWKGVPFVLDYYRIPPIKNNEPVLPCLEDPLLLQQLHLQQRLLLQRQALAKLGQTEPYSSLSLEQQTQMLQHQAQVELSLQATLMTPHSHTPTHTNSNVLAMIHQLAQFQQLHQQQRPGSQVPVAVPVPGPTEMQLDPVQQLMQQMGMPIHSRPASTPQNTPEEQRSIEQFMNAFRQRQTNPQPGLQPQSVNMESVWGGATTAATFPAWSVPPGQPTASQSLWADPVTKGIKTEQEILEEQLRAEEKKKEELREQEEIQRLKEEEEKERHRRIREEEELERERERKRKEEEELEREKERKRIQEEEERKKKEAAVAKKAEQDRLRKEEEKKRKEEEKRRKEEEKRKQEEEKKRAEEEKKRLDEERKKKEEMTKRQNEALKRLQEQQARAVKPAPTHTPAPWTPPETSGTSLADIQKKERKQQQQLREQQEMLKAYQEKHQQEQQQLKNSKSGTNLNLKWAENTKNQPTRVKSLAEIQAEEQERLAKQAEKEKAERMAAVKEVSIAASGSIWATANQSLSWSGSQHTASVWGATPVTNSVGSGARFWDEANTKPTKPSKPAAQQPQTKSQAKTKTKKDEASVLKIFENQIPRTSKTDEFNKWCTKTLSAFPYSVDIPTFVDFLLAFESQKEVREYIRMYLGETKEANDFASEFIERRSRLQSAGQSIPRPESVSTAQSNHFQEVKGKNKKVKKSKMTKVDSRILGFNVTAAPDRINVGDRDYGEGL